MKSEKSKRMEAQREENNWIRFDQGLILITQWWTTERQINDDQWHILQVMHSEFEIYVTQDIQSFESHDDYHKSWKV